MFTSREKKKNNIAEYVLYMWQVEDLIRANQCNINLISKNILSQYQTDPQQKKELTEWWDNLTEMMKLEHKEESGHLQILINTVNDINNLHLRLLTDPDHIPYQVRFQHIEPIICELESKTSPKPENDIALMLGALYHSFMLKLKGTQLTDATSDALKAFAGFLATLSALYKQDQEGKLFRDE